MKKLRAVIQYECITSFRYIWVFYGVELLVIVLIFAIAAIAIGNSVNVSFNCLEMNTWIYVGILGVLGFKEDFKMLIQNGFTRKYIFIATISMFAFISGVMAFVDTIVGNGMHLILPEYNSVFGEIYGYDNLLLNWVWLFLVNILICSACYHIILVISKLGKSSSIYLGVGLGGLILIVTALFKFIVSVEVVNDIGALMVKLMGFSEHGTVNFIYPISTLLLLICIMGTCAYTVIRRIELNH